LADTRDSVPGAFPFDLSTEQEARAARLHSESIVFDMLSQQAGGTIFRAYPEQVLADLTERLKNASGGFDSIYEAFFWPLEMSRLGKSHLIRDWFVEGGLSCGTFGVEVHDGRDPFFIKWEKRTSQYAEVPWLRFVTKAHEIREAKRDGLVALYGHCQPTTPAPRDLRRFDVAYELGLRSFMLTYNQMDNIGVGCTERVDAGLSMFGLDVVRHCNEMGIIVDVSHCGDLTTLDACRHSKKPVNANHTSSRALSSHVRGKTDEGLKAIAGTGGVVGVVAVPAFLSRQPNPTIETMLDHIDYIADLVGWEHVAIGTDYPLQAPDELLRRLFTPAQSSIGFREQDELDILKKFVGFEDCRDLPNITRGLIARGYDDHKIKGILGENALRVFAEVCG
jgi:membrane dipeptidase